MIIQGLIVILFISSPLAAFGQHHEEEGEKNDTHHRLAVVISHTHVPKGAHSVDDSDAVIIPSWGLNYEYWFNSKWAIGLHNDMEIATYIIEDHDGNELERETPVIMSIVGIYNPWHTLQFVAGIGREFEHHERFWVYRFALEYEIEIGHHWDIAPLFVLDLKEGLYNSWTLGLAVGKRF